MSDDPTNNTPEGVVNDPLPSGGQGTWLDSLPAPLREAPFIGKAQNLEDAVGKLAHAAQLLGTSVRVPGDDAKPEDIEAFYEKVAKVPGITRLPNPDDKDGLAQVLAKLGAPADAKEYELPEVAGYEWPEEVAKTLRENAQKAGMTKAQFEQFTAGLGENERDALASTTEATRQEQDQLKADWGAAYAERMESVTKWLNAADAPKELREQAENGELTAATMNWLYNTSAQFKGEAAPGAAAGKGDQGTLTPSQARSEIQTLLNNPAYFNPSDPRQPDLVRRMVQLQKLANAAA